MYSDIEEARMRLSGTIIRYKEAPVKVNNIRVAEDDTGLEVVFTPLGKTRKVVKPINDPLFNKEPIPLGYSNDNLWAYYIMRGPGRRYRQGLCFENAMAIRSDYPSTIYGDSVPLGGNLVHTVMNKYPSFEEAMRSIWDNFDPRWPCTSKAFSRKLAVHRDASDFIFLEHKGRRVGVFNRKRDVAELSPNYDYLFEYLKANGVHTNVG